MKTGVLYAGKTGTTKFCAHELAKKLENVSLVNLENKDPDLNNYDLVIIGASVRFGHMHRKARKLLKGSKEELLKKPLALFICQGFKNEEQVFTENVCKQLRDYAIIMKSFGGELILEKQKGFSYLLSKMLLKRLEKPKIDYDAINTFASTINAFISGVTSLQ